MSQIGEEKTKQFERKLAEKMQDIKVIREQLEEKQKSFVRLQDVCSIRGFW